MRSANAHILSQFAESVRFEELTSEVVEHSKLCMLDTIGCALFGSTIDWSRNLRRIVLSWEGKPQSTVLGTSARVPAPSAALLNGLSTHAFELDDSHTAGIVHPGSTVFSSALASAELEGEVDGRQFVEALVAGYEVAIRMGVSMGLTMIRRGLYSPSICGTFGAAVAAAKIMRFDLNDIEYVLRVAATQASGLYSPSLVKRLNIGFAAQKGLLSALMVKSGFKSETDVFEDLHGGFYRALSIEPQLSAFEDIGRTFKMLDVGFKQYSCARPTFTTLDAIKTIKSEHDFSTGQIEKVTVWTTFSTMSTGYGYPVNDLSSALVNIPYCASVMLIDSRAFIDQFTEQKVRDKKITELMSKIEVKVDPELDKLGPEKRYASRVEITLSDGRTYREVVLQPSGDPQNPTSPSLVLEKFRSLAARVLDVDGVRKIEETIKEMESRSKVVKVFSEIPKHALEANN